MDMLKTPLKFGILTAVILIVYFLVLGMGGVNANPAYSVFNVVITASGIALAIKEIKEKNAGKIHYRRGFETAFLTGIIATVIFSVFFITYFVYAPGFSEKLLKVVGKYANTGGVFATVVIMGVTTSFVVSFALMQLNKSLMYKKIKSKEQKSEASH